MKNLRTNCYHVRLSRLAPMTELRGKLVAETELHYDGNMAHNCLKGDYAEKLI